MDHTDEVAPWFCRKKKKKNKNKTNMGVEDCKERAIGGVKMRSGVLLDTKQ